MRCWEMKNLGHSHCALGACGCMLKLILIDLQDLAKVCCELCLCYCLHVLGHCSEGGCVCVSKVCYTCLVCSTGLALYAVTSLLWLAQLQQLLQRDNTQVGCRRYVNVICLEPVEEPVSTGSLHIGVLPWLQRLYSCCKLK